MQPAPDAFPEQDSAAAWWRLAAALVVATVCGVGLWSTVVVLPFIEAEFAIDRGGASVPYMATMLGFAFGGLLMGRLADRVGIMIPVMLGGVFLCIGYVGASLSTSYWQFVVIQGGVIGLLGSSSTFGPVVADISLWFRRRRGIAVAIAASGNYLAGAIWPPILTAAITEVGWRDAYLGVGIACVVIMVPLAFALRRRADVEAQEPPRMATGPGRAPLPPRTVQIVLCLAGIACCVAMAMPQVHIVAYCVDLNYGPAAGAEMLSVMLTFGVVSRLISGFIADRIGGLGTLILGSALQTVALAAFLPFDGLVSLYLIVGLFGLSQGGIVPSYALIVRDFFPAREAGWRVSLVLMMTVVGMAIGGWMSGEIHDLTGSYTAAFLNGIAWNVVNLGIALWLLFGRSPGPRPVAA